MDKTSMKKLFKAALHDQEILEANKPLLLEVANTYKRGFGYDEAEELNTQASKRWGNTQFVTEHGTFSYLKAVDYYFGKEETQERKFAAACRRHLHPYMMEFKRSQLPCVCPHTGIELTESNSHVDHVGDYEFRHIVMGYFVDFDAINYVKTDDGDRFAEVNDFLDFKRHHDALATLELVHKSHNLTRGR